jgi:hypothetical protein
MLFQQLIVLSSLLVPLYAAAQEGNGKSSVASDSIQIQSRPSYYRFGAESIKLPGDEAMGMIGGNYLMEITPGLYFGPAAYGAITGKRGGFFAAGGELAWKQPLLSNLSLETGFYVGGGGGGTALVGGGLMLRPHVDLIWKFNRLSAGISASQVHFPNGHIKSNQVGVTLSIDDEFVYAVPGSLGTLLSTKRRGGVGFDRIAVAVGSYKPHKNVTDLAGNTYAGSIGYAGFRMDQRLTPNLFWGIESGAAAKGSADGYAEILGVLGLEYPLVSDAVTVGSRVALGMGGGGKLSVGGGALGKAGVFLKTQLSKNSYIALEGGMVHAPDGKFRSNYGNVQVGVDLDYAPFQDTLRVIRGMEWSASAQHYLTANRYNGSDPSLETMVVKIDRDITAQSYFSGQAQCAYAGHAGGYAVGLLGLGLRSPKISSGFSLAAEALLGAAGGGGVSTEGGAVAQVMTYAVFDLNKSVRVKAGLGQIKSMKGTLNSSIVDLSLSFPFEMPGR